MAALKAGMCFINNYNISPVELPFGGYKSSGEQCLAFPGLSFCMSVMADVSSLLLGQTGTVIASKARIPHREIKGKLWKDSRLCTE